MSIENLAAQIFAQATNTDKDKSTIISALVDLFGGNNGEINIVDIIAQFQSSGLEGLVSSWLGDGENKNINIAQILSILGQSKVSSFANKMDMKEDDALSGLGQMIPQLVDQSSSGGSLLDSMGGMDGALKLAKGLF